MLTGQAISFGEQTESNQLLLVDPVSELDDEESGASGKILYTASFEELSRSHMQYDTVIWILISLLLVLAWGVGLVMLLYLPVRRFVLRKDISSRKLFVTHDEIVYKVSRPSFLPFLGFTKIERHIPLPLVVDIIIEQGCLQAVYGIHTFRVENIAHGKPAPMDELQVQGVSNPGVLRKVIIRQASKSIQEVGISLKPTVYTTKGESTMTPVVGSLTEAPATSRSPSLNWKAMASPNWRFPELRDAIPSDLLIHKLEEVKQSVKRIESLIGNQPALPESS